MTEPTRVAVPEGWRPFAWRRCPIWQVTVAKPVPAGQPRAADHPAPITVAALIDSGTSHTFADRSLFDRLSIAATGDSIKACAFDDVLREHENFRVDFAVRSTVSGGALLVLRNWAVSAGAVGFGDGPRQYELIIGCDVLQHCRFTIDGPRGLFRLETVLPEKQRA